MAKVTFGPAVTDARNKVGDVVFTKSRGGNVAKALHLAAPTDPPHNLLSAYHPDTTPSTPPARGSLVSGQEAVTLWKELPLGADKEVLTSDGTDAKWAAAAAGGVSSVGLALPAEFNVSGSPVTGAGILTGAWADEDAKKILAGPISGGAATPAFRLLEPTDLPILDGARVYNSLDLTIPNNSETALTFNSERYDNGGLHEGVTYPSRLTAKKTGVYIITATILWAAANLAGRGLYLKLNATSKIALELIMNTGNFIIAQTISTLYHLAVNDFVEVIVFQNTAVAVKILNAELGSPEFAMQQLTSD